MPPPLRIFLFGSHPEAILIIASGSGEMEVLVPPLASPFRLEVVAKAFGDQKIAARVSMLAATGRWSYALAQAERDEKAERRQREVERARVEAHLYSKAAELEVQERGQLIQRRQLVEAELREVKGELGQAKSKAFATGQYMQVSVYRGLEDRRTQLQNESAAIQARLGELRKLEKAKNPGTFLRRFLEVARRRLDPAEFQAWTEEADDSREEEEA